MVPFFPQILLVPELTWPMQADQTDVHHWTAESSTAYGMLPCVSKAGRVEEDWGTPSPWEGSRDPE